MNKDENKLKDILEKIMKDKNLVRKLEALKLEILDFIKLKITLSDKELNEVSGEIAFKKGIASLILASELASLVAPSLEAMNLEKSVQNKSSIRMSAANLLGIGIVVGVPLVAFSQGFMLGSLLSNVSFNKKIFKALSKLKEKEYKGQKELIEISKETLKLSEEIIKKMASNYKEKDLADTLVKIVEKTEELVLFVGDRFILYYDIYQNFDFKKKLDLFMREIKSSENCLYSRFKACENYLEVIKENLENILLYSNLNYNDKEIISDNFKNTVESLNVCFSKYLEEDLL